MATMNIAESIATELAQAHAAHDEAAAAVIHYKQKIDRLTNAQKAINGILTEDDLIFQVKGGAPRQAKAEGGTKAGNAKVPATPAAFWLKHITAEARSNSEILASAAEELKVDQADKEIMDALKNRLATNLKNFVTDNKIKSSGERKGRKYFL